MSTKPKRLKTYQPGTATNRLRIKRELKQKDRVKGDHMMKDECFVLNSDEDEKDDEEIATIAGAKVLPSDFDILKCSSGWLNGCLINAGQSLLKAKFPDTLA